VIACGIALVTATAGAQTSPEGADTPAESLRAARALRAPLASAPFLPPGAPTTEAEPRRLSDPIAVPLFASFIGTQALDVHSTLRSIRAGNAEANTIVRWATARPAAFITLKAATTATSLFLVERFRRHHPKPAMFLLVGLNTASATIAAHNYRATARRR